MKLPLIAFVFWCLFLGTFLRIALVTNSFAWAFFAAASYAVASLSLERSGYQWHWLRRSAFTRWLRSWFAEGGPILLDVPHQRQTIYAVEPHGEACLGFATTFVPANFANSNIRLLAWSGFRFIPFLRDIYFLSGIVPATQASAERWMRAGADLALIPSGMMGLYHAVVERGPNYDKSSGRRVITVYRVKLGFCALAIKHRALLMPVLSCCEDLAFRKLRLLESFPFLSTVCLPTGVRAEVMAGAALDAANYRDVETLARDYYARLAELANEAGYKLVVVDSNKELKREKSS
jgi:hypothetical protein